MESPDQLHQGHLGVVKMQILQPQMNETILDWGLKISISNKHLFKKLTYLFIYLFLAVLGLRCCAQAFPSCGERGLLFLAVSGLLIAVASLVAEHGL